MLTQKGGNSCQIDIYVDHESFLHVYQMHVSSTLLIVIQYRLRCQRPSKTNKYLAVNTSVRNYDHRSEDGTWPPPEFGSLESYEISI